MNYASQYRNPPAVTNLLIINVLVFVGMQLLLRKSGENAYEVFLDRFALYPLQSPWFRWWQPLTHMFMHANMLHLFSNMFALWMFGRSLEQYWGTKRFLTYYFVCGFGAAAVQLLVNYIAPGSTIGASGAVFGVLLGFGVMFPNVRLMLFFPPIPIRARLFVIIYGLFELFAGVTGTMPGIAHYAHLGGMIFGFFLIRYWKRRGKRY